MTLANMQKKILLALVAFAVCVSASAQRTARAQFFIDARGVVSFPEFTFGASLGMGQYRSLFYWDAGLSLLSDRVYFSNGKSAPFVDYLAGGGASWRALSSRTRGVSLYLGGQGFLGAEVYDPAGVLSPAEKTLVDGSVFSGARFVYGLKPQVTLEGFVWNRLAVVLSASMPLVFNSRVSVVRGAVSLGLRYNL